MRVLANYLFNPVETSQEWSQKGLNVYSQTVFNEEFAMNRIFCVIFDAINMLIGWGTYWAIARYSSQNGGGKLFSKIVRLEDYFGIHTLKFLIPLVQYEKLPK